MEEEAFNILITNEDIYNEITSLLKDAEKEIILFSPWIELDGHIGELINHAIKRSVKITILTRKPFAENQKRKDDLKYLSEIGCNIQFDNLLHSKMVIVDRSVSLICSANILPLSLNKNHEIGILSTDDEIVNQLLGYLKYQEENNGFVLLSNADELFRSTIKKSVDFVKKILNRRKTEPNLKENELNCPKCVRGTLLEKNGKFGRFYGCSTYPNCKYTQNIEYTDI